MWEKMNRVMRSAMISFWRNGWLSTATILVMVLTLIVIGGLLLSSVLMNAVLDSLQKKIDVSVYFLPDTPEGTILAFQEELQKIPDVAAVSYVSQEEALRQFKEKHKDNSVIIESLGELGGNPLEASLNLTASDPSKFPAIVSAIEAMKQPSISKINFYENQKVIERLSSVMRASRTAGASLAAILAFIAILIAFNTVRLAIYSARDEINVMRLVGATAWYIRGPFLIEGMLDGTIAAVVTLILFIPVVRFISPKIEFLVGGINLWSYFISNMLEFFGILVVVGLAIGALSSFLAIRRYLRV